MATYVNNLRLKEITTGDESGTWGTSTNTNLELIADAFGSGTEGITTNADTHTTTIADGAADEGRAIFLKYTGTLDSACTITIAPNTVNKLWLIENATSGSQNIIISQGSGANITIGNGKIAAVFTDGAGSGAAVLDAFADLELSSTLTVAGASTLTGAVTAAAGITMTGTTPTLTIGDAGAEDTKIVFDGAAQDYYVGLDDTDDDLKIGLGSTVGTTSAITIDENQDTTITQDLAVSGVGPHSFGAARVNNVRFNVAGAFTSGGVSDYATGFNASAAITGAVGDTVALAGAIFQNTITTQGTDTNISRVAQVMINEPQISNNLASSGKPDVAATLWIQSAPTEGDVNAALYVADGLSYFAGNIEVFKASASQSPDSSADNIVIENSGSAGISILTGTGDSGSIMFGDSGDNGRGKLYYDHNADRMYLAAGGSIAMTINASQVVSIGTTGITPPGTQKVIISANSVTSTTNWQLAIEGSADAGVLFIEDGTKRGLVGYDAGESRVMLGDNDGDNSWRVSTSANALYAYVNGVENLGMDASSVVVNDGGTSGIDFRVESDLNANMIHIDASNRGRWGMGAAPDNNAWFYAKGEIIADYWSGGTNSVYYFDGKAHASVDDDAYVFRVHGDLVEAASGTHAIFAGAYFDKPAITAGSATVTKSVNVYIKNAGTGGSSNYALYVAAGRSQLGGPTDYLGVGVDPSYMLHVKYLNDSLGQRRAAHIENGDDDTPEGLNIHYSNSEPNNAAYPFLQCSDENTATRLAIWSNGGVVNVGNSYGATSDRILKQDIVDANSQWDDVKALAAMGKNYRFIADVESQGDDAITHIGLVAQDVETVSPGLVDQVETERDGLRPKELKYSVMYMKAFLALGEAMNRIEDLESRIEALEA